MPLANRHVENSGFTLVELVVTLAVAAILMSVAAPSFRDALTESRQTVIYNELVGALQLARSEAIKRAAPMAVCARSTNSVCGSDWTNGWLVFVDTGDTVGRIDAGETVVQVQAAIAPPSTMSNRARTGTGVADPIERNFVRFGPRGTSNWRGGGSFVLCNRHDDGPARALNLTLSGDLRRARMSDGELVDFFNQAIRCS